VAEATALRPGRRRRGSGEAGELRNATPEGDRPGHFFGDEEGHGPHTQGSAAASNQGDRSLWTSRGRARRARTSVRRQVRPKRTPGREQERVAGITAAPWRERSGRAAEAGRPVPRRRPWLGSRSRDHRRAAAWPAPKARGGKRQAGDGHHQQRACRCRPEPSQRRDPEDRHLQRRGSARGR